MRKTSRGIVAALALSVMLALGSCGGSSAEQTTDTQTEEQQAEAEAGEDLTDDGSIPLLALPNSIGGMSLDLRVIEPEEMSDEEVDEAERAIRAYTPPTQESLLINEAPSFFYYDNLTGNAKGFYEAIDMLCEDPTSTDHLVKMTINTTVTTEDLMRDIALARLALQYDHPEYFWLYDGIETDIDARGNTQAVYLTLTKPYDNYEKEMKAFNDATKAFLDDIDLDAPDQEVAMAIHDKLCDLVSYDYDVMAKAESSTTDEPALDFAHTAYGSLVQNSSGEKNMAVCDGYSLAYEYLLQQAGIESAVVVGIAGASEAEAGYHAWNIVKLDGDWYEVDSTWDDENTQWSTLVEQVEAEDPQNEALPYYKQALSDEAYVGSITHFLYDVRTSEITDYDPGSKIGRAHV